MAWADFIETREILNSFNAPALARSEELGSQLAFAKAPGVVQNAQRLTAQITDAHRSIIPDQSIDGLVNALRPFVNTLSAISQFRVDQPNAAQQKVALEQQLQNQYGGMFPAITSILSAIRSFDEPAVFEKIRLMERDYSEYLSKITSKAEANAASVSAGLAEAKSNAEEKTVALQRLFEQVQAKAAEIISTKESEHFSLASDRYRKSAITWLRLTFGGVILLFIFSGLALALALNGFYRSMDTASTTQIVVAKVIFLGVIGYFTAISAKNFYANKHNQAVNEHRANAIASYRAIMEATTTPEHKDIILTQAASAVFAPQDTAFVRQVASTTEVPTTIINSLTKPLTGA